MGRGVLKKMRSSLDRTRLGELLVLKGAITPSELRFALAQTRDVQKPLGAVLVHNRMIVRHQLYQALAQQWGLRILAALMTLTLSIAVFGVKPAKASSVRDIPAQMSLVSVANAAFGSVQSYPALFGASERRSANLKPFTKWTGMFDRFERDIKTSEGQKVLSEMKADLVSLKGLPLPKMAERVNTMINRVPYITDDKNWGVSDYWATPVEFMRRGGDCEDYAIAKYVALRALGVPEDRLRIAIVHDLQKNIPHAILIVYTDEGAMILDNQARDARFSTAINRYKPIFSINRTGWWLHAAPKDTLLASAGQ